MRAFLADGEQTSVGTSTSVKISSFSFLRSFFFFFFVFSCSVPFLLVFLNYPDQSHQEIFSGEHRNIAGSTPPHNSLGIVCSGKIPQNTKRNKMRGLEEESMIAGITNLTHGNNGNSGVHLCCSFSRFELGRSRPLLRSQISRL